MRRIIPFCLLLVLPAVGQPPVAPPPALFPPGVSGKPLDPVTPVVAVAPKGVPLDRFKVPGYPADTVAAVESAKESAGWLIRMSQSDGKFLPGVDPTLAKPTAGTDVAQAHAACALARAAKFTGDEKAAAAASQACLTLLTLAKPDTTDPAMRVPTIGADRGNKVAFAALLAAAIYDLPGADAKLVGEADKLCRYLASRLLTDGGVKTADDDKAESDPAVAGLVFQALLASDRANSADWKRKAVTNGVAGYAAVFKKTPRAELCGALLPAVCDLALKTKDKAATDFALAMADWLTDRQYTSTDARVMRWVGGVKPAVGDEPTVHTACCAEGLAAAVTLAAEVPDGTRYARYRKGVRTALGFVRGLQFSTANRNAGHFEEKFRAQWLYGGAFGGPSDGLVRCEHTAAVLNAQLRYLECGGEKE